MVTPVIGAGYEPDGVTLEKTDEGIIRVKDSGISSVKLKTSTGSVSGSYSLEAWINVVMNDFCFFPNIIVDGDTAYYWNVIANIGSIPIPTDTVGRFALHFIGGTTRTYYVYWRYVTASKPPDIVVVHDGKHWHVWCSELQVDPKEALVVKPKPDTILHGELIKLTRTDKEDLFKEVKPDAYEIRKVLETHEILKEKALSIKDKFAKKVA